MNSTKKDLIERAEDADCYSVLVAYLRAATGKRLVIIAISTWLQIIIRVVVDLLVFIGLFVVNNRPAEILKAQGRYVVQGVKDGPGIAGVLFGTEGMLFSETLYVMFRVVFIISAVLHVLWAVPTVFLTQANQSQSSSPIKLSSWVVMTSLISIFDVIVLIYVSVKLPSALDNLSVLQSVTLDANIRFGAAAIPLYLSRGLMLIFNISAAYIVYLRVKEIKRSLPYGSDGNSTITDPFGDNEDLVRPDKKPTSRLPEPEDFTRHRNSKQEPYYRTNSDASNFTDAKQPAPGDMEPEFRPTNVPQRLFRKNTASPAPARKLRGNSFRNDVNDNQREIPDQNRRHDTAEASTSFGESRVTFGKTETKFQKEEREVFRAIPYVDEEVSRQEPRPDYNPPSDFKPPPAPPPLEGHDNGAFQSDDSSRPSSTVAGARDSVLSASRKGFKLPTGAFTYLSPQTPVLSEEDSQSDSSRRGSLVAPPPQRTAAPPRSSAGTPTVTYSEEIEPDYD